MADHFDWGAETNVRSCMIMKSIGQRSRPFADSRCQLYLYLSIPLGYFNLPIYYINPFYSANIDREFAHYKNSRYSVLLLSTVGSPLVNLSHLCRLAELHTAAAFAALVLAATGTMQHLLLGQSNVPHQMEAMRAGEGWEALPLANCASQIQPQGFPAIQWLMRTVSAL